MNEMIFRSDWWSVRVPRGWRAVEEEHCVTLTHGQFPSALQISAAKKEAPVTDQDLREFAADHVSDETLLQTVNLEAFTGVFAERFEKGVFWREWWLRAGTLMIYLSYNVDERLKGSETQIVDQVVGSLRPCEECDQ